jgi:hypothetical protein
MTCRVLGGRRDEEVKHENVLPQLSRRLEAAARKHNESAAATCSVAECFETSDGELSDKMFERIFEAVAELARVLVDRKPNYKRAARELLAKSRRRRANRDSQ